MALNNVTLTGRLVSGPISKSIGTDGIAVCQFTLAVDKKGKDAGANFIDCVAWRGAANAISTYAKKGQMLGITGSLDQQTWEKDGHKNSKIQVVVSDFAFLSPKGSEKNASEAPKTASTGSENDFLSQIPF